MLAASRQLRRGPFVHAARFDIGTALEPLQSRDLLALLSDDPLELRNLTEQLQHKLLQLGV
jgi:hypothetical protein